MTRPTSTSTEQTADGAEDFTTGEGLRALLNRLAEGGEMPGFTTRWPAT